VKPFLRNLLFPHKDNNYKAKILHHSTLTLLILFIFVCSITLNVIGKNFPQVLGITTNITSEELLNLLNQKRRESNLSSLSLSPQLSKAAFDKANHMIANNYWSHYGPDGKSPWDFIRESGYSYAYAGENLARGFTNSSDVTDAWMASSSHRQNMLSSNYSDVGFAIVAGRLNGEETVLVVEEFGAKNVAVAPKPESSLDTPEVKKTENESIAQNQPQVLSIPKDRSIASSHIKNNPTVDSTLLTLNFGTFLIGVVIFSLISEVVILERRKVVSFARHNPDHVIFLISILLFMLILGRGLVI
jgi:hypothetical protein